MVENNAAEIKRKLLELQNELLKGVIEKGETVPPSPKTENADPKPVSKEENDIITLLKELSLNQQRIISILGEINNKLK